MIDDLIKFQDWFREADDKFDEHLDSTYIVSNVYRQPAGIGVVRQWLDKFEKDKGASNEFVVTDYVIPIAVCYYRKTFPCKRLASIWDTATQPLPYRFTVTLSPTHKKKC